MKSNQLHIAIINGPNMNLVGRGREPEIYGRVTIDDYVESLKQVYPQVHFSLFQSNHEGDIIDELQRVGFSAHGIVLNAAAYTHTSIAIADTVRAITAPVVEVHISDVNRREPYRQVSMRAPACIATVAGEGIEGYRHAVDILLNYQP